MGDREIDVLAHGVIRGAAGILRIDRLNTYVGGAFDHVARMTEFRLGNLVGFLFAVDHELQALHHGARPALDFVALIHQLRIRSRVARPRPGSHVGEHAKLGEALLLHDECRIGIECARLDDAVAHRGDRSFSAANGHECHVFLGIHAVILQDHGRSDFRRRTRSGSADHLSF